MSQHDVFRDEKVHVRRQMCKTCVFHPGNRMHLRAGRVEQMVADAKQAESAIICHLTLDGPNSVCRGFFDQHPTQPLQIAERLNYVEFT